MTKLDNSKFLDIISVVLRKEPNFPSSIASISDDIYTEVNDIQNGLNSEMDYKSYPASPELIKSLNDLIATSDGLAAVPFLHNIKVEYLSCRMTGINIKLLEPLIIGYYKWISDFSKIMTNHTIIVYKAEKPAIYAQNQNRYISELTMEDYSVLVSGCFEHNIPLYKFVKHFVIGLPLKYDIAFIFEGGRRNHAYNMYSSIICDTAIVANMPYDKTKDGNFIESMMPGSVIINNANTNLKQEIKSSFDKFKCPVITNDQFQEELLKDQRPAFLSLYDHFLNIVTPVEIWYDTQLSSLKDLSDALNKDIIQSYSDNHNETTINYLKNKNSELKQKLEQYKSEKKEILELVEKIGNNFKKIDNLLCPHDTSEYLVTRHSIDPVLKVIFNYADNKNIKKNHKEFISRLVSLRYVNTAQVESYIYDKAEYNHDVSLWSVEWEKAKLFLNSISISDILTNESSYKNLIIYALKCIKEAGMQCKTANELFLKGFVSDNDIEQDNCYKAAVYMGSKDAANALWSKCQRLSDPKKKYFLTRDLANFLFSPACNEITKLDIQKTKEDYRNKQKIYNIHRLRDKNLFYYKLLATKGDTAALAQIVDIIYMDSFDKAYKIEPKATERIRVSYALIYLCDELIDNGYDTIKYKEIKGVLLYCLDYSNSIAFDCLDKSCSTAAGHFCLGRIYQYGNGRIPQDLNKAFAQFKQCSSHPDFSQRSKESMNKINKWKADNEARKKDSQRYREEEDYSYNSSYDRSDSDGCITGDSMVTMGDGSVKRVDEIKSTDLIMTWDMDNGCLAHAPLMGFHRGQYIEEHNVLKVIFDDETTVSVIGEHLFFDCDLNKFIAITEGADNTVYIGHRFAKAIENGYIKVVLKSITIAEKTRLFYAPIPERHLTYIVNGMISVNAKMLSLCNRFDIDTTKLCYARKSRENDLKKYSMLSYDCVKNIVSKEFFKRNAAYEYGVAIGKGLISQHDLIELIILYRNYLFD